MHGAFNRKTRSAERRDTSRGADDQTELALLAEFVRHESVATLAAAIAERLGGDVRDQDLIAYADLALRQRKV